MHPIFKLLVPLFVFIVGVLPVFVMVPIWHRRARRRFSPLTRNLLRPPGYSLQRQVDELNNQIDGQLMMAVLMPMLGYASYLTLAGTSLDRFPGGLLTILLIVAILCWVYRKLWILISDRRIKILGLEGEQAAGEELNQLMLDKCRVFHDVPIEYGNVDHVVVSSSGVFAINTKMLGKVPEHSSNPEAIVDYDSKEIIFPDRRIPIPTDKSEMEAKTLSKWLTSAVGQPVAVKSMLALPGWFIKRKGKETICVFNPRNSQKFFQGTPGKLPDELQKQIAHQLEQQCRDVEPAFKQNKAWGK